MTAVAKLPEISTFIEQMDMLRDDFVKYQDGNKSVPFVVLRDALVAALNAYDDARAALSPAELGGVEPAGYADGGRLHELKEGRVNIALFAEPLGGHTTPLYTTPRAAEAVAVAVDDPMIYRFRFAYEGCPIQPSEHERVRIALTAALTPPSAKGE